MASLSGDNDNDDWGGLLTQSQKDMTRFTAFVVAVDRPLFRFLYWRALALLSARPQTHFVEEVLQVVLTKVFRHLSKYDPGKGTGRAWVKTIALRTLKDATRKLWRPPPLSLNGVPSADGAGSVNLDVIDPQAPGPSAAMEAAELQQWLQDLLQQLRPLDRQVLKLHYLEGLSYKEIIAVLKLNVSIGGLGKRISDIKLRLRKLAGPERVED
jgi:RNA polymerase sigma factor (sigma-70 family)